MVTTNKTKGTTVAQNNSEKNKEDEKEKNIDEKIEEDEDEIKALEDKVECAENKAKEEYDRFLRVSAEFENYKKRSIREINEFRKFANEVLLKKLLSVVDNLERAITSDNDDTCNDDKNKSIIKGVDIILKEILSIFEKFNTKPFDSVGKEFNPGYHQAVSQEKTDEYPDNVVITEFQKGYLIHDRLLRPAMVVVSKNTKTNEK